jgi:hypothetical protein
MRLAVAILVAAAAGLPAASGASQRFAGATGTYSYAYNDSFGSAIAFAPDGDAVIAGRAPGCGGNDLLVVRVDRSFGTVRWTKLLDYSACMDDTGRAVAMSGDNACIAVGGMTNYVLKVASDGSVVWRTALAGDEMYAIAVDPVDGTLWVLSGMTMAPAHATLHHLAADGGLITSEDYQDNGVDTAGTALAVTRDYVYIGGWAWDSFHANYVAWLMARNRATGAVPWSYRVPFETANKSIIRSLAAGHGRLCSVYVKDMAGSQSGYMVVHNALNGAFTSTSAQVFSSWGAAMSAVDYPGRIAMHPTIPMVVAGGAATLQGFSLDGTELWNISSVNTTASSPAIGGIAVSNELDYTVGVAYTQGIAPYWAGAIGETFRSGFTDGKNTSDQLLVAPNVLDLSDRSAALHFVIARAKGGAGQVRLFDTTGQLVHSLAVTLDFAGRGDASWDGFVSATQRIGPGSYVAVATGPGLSGARKSFLVVAKRPK